MFEFREKLFSKHSLCFSLVDKAVMNVKKPEVFILLPFGLQVCVYFICIKFNFHLN